MFLTFLFAASTLIFGVAYLYTDGIPALSDFIVRQLPNDVDKELGKAVKEEVFKQYRVDEDKTEILKEFYNELSIDPKTKIYVVKGSEFNAFAAPGNYIFVIDDVLESVKSYEELAALLFHEYAHVKHRHGLRTLAHALSRELITALIFGDDKGMGELIRNANLLLTLGNSREFETQADIEAFKMFKQKKLDTKGLIDLFKRLEKLERSSGSKAPSYLNTHPDSEERLDLINDSIQASPYNSFDNATLNEIFERLTQKKETYYYGW